MRTSSALAEPLLTEYAPTVELVSPLTRPPRGRSMLLCLLMVLALMGPVNAPAAEAAQAPATAESTGEPSQDWTLPITGQLGVVRPFAAPPTPWAAGHRGVDLAAAAGGRILAPADGVVSFSGVVVDREVLSVDHGSGLVSSFEAVDSGVDVGDSVLPGEVIATLSTSSDGSTHCPDQPCLHWGVRLHGEYINPLLLTGDLEPSVLLPLEPGG